MGGARGGNTGDGALVGLGLEALQREIAELEGEHKKLIKELGGPKKLKALLEEIEELKIIQKELKKSIDVEVIGKANAIRKEVGKLIEPVKKNEKKLHANVVLLNAAIEEQNGILEKTNDLVQKGAETLGKLNKTIEKQRPVIKHEREASLKAVEAAEDSLSDKIKAFRKEGANKEMELQARESDVKDGETGLLLARAGFAKEKDEGHEFLKKENAKLDRERGFNTHLFKKREGELEEREADVKIREIGVKGAERNLKVVDSDLGERLKKIEKSEADLKTNWAVFEKESKKLKALERTLKR